MRTILYKNEKLSEAVSSVCEVAKLINQKSWSEGKCGFLSIDITDVMPSNADDYIPISPAFPLGFTLPSLKNRYYFCKGKKVSMRDFAKFPMDNGSIIRVCDSCDAYEVVADKYVKPEDEISAHLAVYNIWRLKCLDFKSIIHAYPVETRVFFMDKNNIDNPVDKLTESAAYQKSMFKRGIVFSDSESTKWKDFAPDMRDDFAENDFLIWSKHGVFISGENPFDAFDKMSALNHCCDVFIRSKNFLK